MIFFFLFLAAWTGALLGWGIVLQRLLGVSLEGWRDADRLAIRVLLGHLPVITVGYLIHLIAPLAGWPGVAVLVAGWAFSLAGLRKARPALRTVGLFAGSLLLVSLFIARPMVHGDTGGYHAQAVLWMAEEPVIRGLANLTATFAYNTSWWILAALMAWPGGAPVGAMSVSGPLLAATGALLLGALWRILRREAGLADWFWVPALYLWLRQIVGLNTPSPTTDIPANLLVLCAIWLVVRRDKLLPLLVGEEGRCFLAVALLAATAKLSASPLLAAGLVWLAVTWVALLIQKHPDAKAIGSNILHLLPLGVCGLVFLYHGWLLSGYPLFPSTFGGFLTPAWALPAWLADFTVERARSWAFTYGASAEQIQSSPAWKLWLYGQSGVTNLLIAGTAAVGAGISGIFLLKNRAALQSGLRLLWLPTTICLLGLVWNLAHVPSLRFSSGFAFAFLGCAFSLAGPGLSLMASRISLLAWSLLCVVALSRLAVARPVSSLFPPPPLPPMDLAGRTTKQGDVIQVGTFPWFAPKPAVIELEYDSNLVILRSPTGRMVEMHGGKTKRTPP